MIRKKIRNKLSKLQERQEFVTSVVISVVLTLLIAGRVVREDRKGGSSK